MEFVKLFSIKEYALGFTESTTYGLSIITEVFYRALDKNGRSVGLDIWKAVNRFCMPAFYATTRATVTRDEYLV